MCLWSVNAERVYNLAKVFPYSEICSVSLLPDSFYFIVCFCSRNAYFYSWTDLGADLGVFHFLTWRVIMQRTVTSCFHLHSRGPSHHCSRRDFWVSFQEELPDSCWLPSWRAPTDDGLVTEVVHARSRLIAQESAKSLSLIIARLGLLRWQPLTKPETCTPGWLPMRPFWMCSSPPAS